MTVIRIGVETPMNRLLSMLTISLWAGVAALPAHAAGWSVIEDKTKLGFMATNNGKEFTGKFGRFSAAIVFDPDDLAGSKVTVVIDTGSVETGFPQDQNEAAKGKDWFNTAAFPKARFETTAFRGTGANAYEAGAKLTIRDVTKDVVLPFTLHISGDTAHMKGEVTIDRTVFHVGEGTTSKWFGTDVKVTVDLTARRKS